MIFHYTLLQHLETCFKNGFTYSKTCVKRPLSQRLKIGFQDQLLLNAGQKEHSAIPLTFIKLPFVIKIFVLSIFEWSFYIGFTVYAIRTKISPAGPHNLVTCKWVKVQNLKKNLDFSKFKT